MQNLLIYLLAFSIAFTSCNVLAESPPISAAKPDRSIGIEIQRDNLVGHWYGDAPTRDGGRRKWIVNRRADGTFKISFRVTNQAGEVFEQTEGGEWGVTGNQLVTVTRGWFRGNQFEPADTAQNYFWDVYWINAFDGKELTYTNQATGNKFTVKRVTDDFTLPTDG